MAISFELKDIKPLLGGLFGGKSDDAPPPDAQPQPPVGPPPPPQPTPAVAGFSEWSADPQNQQKVAHGITPPGQPIIPQDVRQQATQMASLTPPPAPNFASLSGPPNLPPAVSPAVSPAAPPPNPLQTKLNADQSELSRLQTTGSGASQIKNKPGRIAAEIADVAGSILAPRAAAAIPGTTAHNYMLQDRAQNRVTNDQASITAQSNADYKSQQADTAQQKADIAQQQENLREQREADQLEQNYKKIGMMKDANGNWVENPSSTFIQAKNAQIEAAKAQESLRQAQADYAKAKNNPNSPLFQQAVKTLAVRQQEANAAVMRAQGYWGNYLKGAYNVGLNGEALPGAPIITNDQGQQTTVGATNAASATKANANAAQFNDVHGALDNLESSADALIRSGGKLNSPGVAAALARPSGELSKWLQGEGVKANLSPEERNYVTSVAAAHENIQALRKSAGGTATDSSVEKLDALIPNSSTPDIDYLKRQTGQIRQTAERLGVGVTTAAGGLKVRGQGKGTTPPPTGNQPQVKVGQPVKLKNGQTITVKVVHPDGSFE